MVSSQTWPASSKPSWGRRRRMRPVMITACSSIATGADAVTVYSRSCETRSSSAMISSAVSGSGPPVAVRMSASGWQSPRIARQSRAAKTRASSSTTVAASTQRTMTRARGARSENDSDAPGLRARDRAIAGRGDERRVLREDARRVARLRPLDVAEALGELIVREVDAQLARLDVDGDDVALVECRQGSSARRLGRDVPDHEPVRGAREAAVGDQRDVLAGALADDRRSDVQHLAHAGPAGRALVADHDDVALVERARLDRREAVLLGIEHARGTAVQRPFMAGELDHAALGCEVAVEDREAAGGLDRALDRHDDLLPGRLLGPLREIAERAAADAQGARVDEVALLQLARDECDAAGLVHVGGDELPTRLEAGDDRGARGDALEVVEREVDAELARDRDQVHHAVRRATCCGDAGRSVLERVARYQLGGTQVAAHDVHHEPAGGHRRVGLALVRRRDAGERGWADTQEVECGRHRVGGEHPAAGPGPRQGDRLELVQLGGRHRAAEVAADALEDVLDRDVLALVGARRDRAVVEHEPGDVHARERHRRGRDRLVAADQADEAVEVMGARRELD